MSRHGGGGGRITGSDDRRAAPCKENVVSKNRRVADPPVNSAAGCGVPTPGRRGKQPIRGGIDASQDSRDCRGRVRPRARSRSRSVRAGLTKHRAAQSVVSGAGQRPWVQLSRVRPRRDLLRGRRAQRGELEQHRSGVAVRRRLHENALITATMGRSSRRPIVHARIISSAACFTSSTGTPSLGCRHSTRHAPVWLRRCEVQ
jgi:hypothetical protein